MSLPRKIATVSLAFAVVFASVTITAQSAQAADPVESITLSPVSKSYKVDAGQTISDTLTILNDGQTAYDFSVYATPYSVASTSYDQNFSENKPNADAYTWIQFEKTTYHIESRQTLEIPYTVHVREDASPGGHYGTIFAEIQPGKDGGQLARKKRVGCIIYATVNGDVKLAGKVASITTPWFQTSAPMRANTQVQNTGNTDFPTVVGFQVSTIFGRTVYAVQNTYQVLPNTTRQVDMVWSNAAWFGVYKVHTAVKVLGKTTTRDSYVLMTPVWLLLLLGLTALFGGVYALTRKSHRPSGEA